MHFKISRSKLKIDQHSSHRVTEIEIRFQTRSRSRYSFYSVFFYNIIFKILAFPLKYDTYDWCLYLLQGNSSISPEISRWVKLNLIFPSHDLLRCFILQAITMIGAHRNIVVLLKISVFVYIFFVPAGHLSGTISCATPSLKSWVDPSWDRPSRNRASAPPNFGTFSCAQPLVSNHRGWKKSPASRDGKRIFLIEPNLILPTILGDY